MKKPTPKKHYFSCPLSEEEYAALKKLSEDNCPPGYKPSLTGEFKRLILEASKPK